MLIGYLLDLFDYVPVPDDDPVCLPVPHNRRGEGQRGRLHLSSHPHTIPDTLPRLLRNSIHQKGTPQVYNEQKRIFAQLD